MQPGDPAIFEEARETIADITGDPSALDLGPVLTARELYLLAYESAPRPGAAPRPPASGQCSRPSFDWSEDGIARYVNGLCAMAGAVVDYGLYEPDPREYSFSREEAVADAAMWSGIIKATWLKLDGFAESALSYLDGAIELWKQVDGPNKLSRCHAERAEIAGLAGDRSAAGAGYEDAAAAERTDWRAELFRERAAAWRTEVPRPFGRGWFERELGVPLNPGVVTALEGHRLLRNYVVQPH